MGLKSVLYFRPASEGVVTDSQMSGRFCYRGIHSYFKKQ